jgi:outer membrane protein assembly factor BamB
MSCRLQALWRKSNSKSNRHPERARCSSTERRRGKRLEATACLGLTLLLGAGPAPAVWPAYQYYPTHNAVFAGDEASYRWSYDGGAKINGGLAVVGNTIYAETFVPSAIALDRRTGKLLWSTPMPNIVMTTPIVADGVVIVGTGRDQTLLDNGRTLIWGVPGGDEIAALSAGSGRVVWTYRTVGEDMPSPALARVGSRDAIVFANGDDRVRALDMRTGKLLWSTQVVGVSTMASAASVDGVVYVLAGTSANMHLPDHVYAVRANDGTILWKAPYGNADVSPVVGSGKVVVEDAQTFSGPPSADAYNAVYCLDAGDGRLVWRNQSDSGFLTSIGSNEEAIAGMIDRGALFQSLPAARRFAAFDLATGHVLWSTKTKAAVKMSAIAFDGRVYVGDTAGVFYVLAEGNGRVLNRTQFGAPFTTSSPVIVGRTLYVADDDRIAATPLR